MKTKSTKLCDLSDSELTTGSRVSEMLKSAGYTESASTVINTNSWWDMTVDELERELAGQKPNYSEYTTQLITICEQLQEPLTQRRVISLADARIYQPEFVPFIARRCHPARYCDRARAVQRAKLHDAGGLS